MPHDDTNILLTVMVTNCVPKMWEWEISFTALASILASASKQIWIEAIILMAKFTATEVGCEAQKVPPLIYDNVIRHLWSWFCVTSGASCY